MLSVIIKSSKMIDIFNCCNGCSSLRKLPRYSFPKKLLVAMAVVVTMSLILPPTEAGIANRGRHKHLESRTQTKDLTRHHNGHLEREKLRHKGHKIENLTLKTKPSKQTKPNHSSYMAKIFRQLRYAKESLKDDWQNHPTLREMARRYDARPPSWVPNTNFIAIHNFLDDTDRKAEKGGKFKFIIQRLYKSLVEFRQVFLYLQRQVQNYPDTPINSPKLRRESVLRNTSEKLNSAIVVIQDAMEAFGMKTPNITGRDISAIPPSVNESESKINDFLAFRAYKKNITNWLKEYRCSKKRNAHKKDCREWDAYLKKKKLMNKKSS